jgi:hypothetical protein
VPVWAAYPAVGFGDRAALPSLRSDAADRLIGRDQPVTWPLALLHLVAEGARAGLCTLDRLEEAAGPRRPRFASANGCPRGADGGPYEPSTGGQGRRTLSLHCCASRC